MRRCSRQAHRLTDRPAQFSVPRSVIEGNEVALRAALIEEGASDDDAAAFARFASRTISGVALWPRLVLDAHARVR